MTCCGENPPADAARPKILYILRLVKISMHPLRRLRLASIALIAVLCLLGVQQGATFHALSHLADGSATGPQKHLPHSKTCDKCVVYAEVSGAGPTTTHAALPIPAQFMVTASAAQRIFPSRTLPAYSARAPPIFL